MSFGLTLFNTAGADFYSTKSQTWNYVGSFIVPDGYSQGTVRQPSSGSNTPASSIGYCSWTMYSSDGTMNGAYYNSLYWGGVAVGSVSGSATTAVFDGWTYYIDASTKYSGWFFDPESGVYYAEFGIYRTQTQTIFTPQVVTQTFPTLSMMSEVTIQRSAVDNVPSNQEGYIHSASRNGDSVTASGGNIRTLVIVLGR